MASLTAVAMHHPDPGPYPGFARLHHVASAAELAQHGADERAQQHADQAKEDPDNSANGGAPECTGAGPKVTGPGRTC